MVVGELFLPRVEGVGKKWNRLHDVHKGTVVVKAKSPRVPRIIQGLVETGDKRYLPLVSLSANEIDPATLPHVTMEALGKILADAAYEKNKLVTARKKKTSIRTAPVKEAAYRPIKKMKSPFEQKKQVEMRKLNDIIRGVLGETWTYEQLFLLIYGFGYSLTEPSFASEVPFRPLRPEKLKGMKPGEARIIRKKHRERMILQGNIYHR
ncbi:hypothetical protein HZA76_02405 [Candidatus Roizmanbacteria bacterium]|nr:hypothetical protein [Candidatus Roizmanbacteria bacterium]